MVEAKSEVVPRGELEAEGGPRPQRRRGQGRLGWHGKRREICANCTPHAQGGGGISALGIFFF